jgi:hypothetical protein
MNSGLHNPLRKKNLCSHSASELYQPSDRCLSAKLVPTFADRGYHVVSATYPHGCILSFMDQSHYCFLQVAPQLYPRGWVGPVLDPVLLRKSGSVRNRTRDLWIYSQELWPLDHRGGLHISLYELILLVFGFNQAGFQSNRHLSSLYFMVFRNVSDRESQPPLWSTGDGVCDNQRIQMEMLI